MESMLVVSLNKHWFQRLKTNECPDSTMFSCDPVVWEKARGSKLWDVVGGEYIDLCAGFGSLAIGHNHPSILKMLTDVSSTSLVQGTGDLHGNIDKIKLLESIQRFLPFTNAKGSLLVTGSQAIEYAMKTACLATGGSGFIVFSGGYHGLDLGALPLTSSLKFKKPFRSLIKEDLVDSLAYGCNPEHVETAIRKQKSRGIQCAAVIVEPILGRGGVILPPAGWLFALRKICKAQGVLLVFDEVLTGLGRVGANTAAQEVGCDLICLGKALGGGMPISACFGSSELMDSWPSCTSEALHTGTFFGHPLGCRIGFLTLQVIRKDHLVARSRKLGELFLLKLRQELLSHPLVVDIRGKGLMLAIEFSKDGLGEVFSQKLLKRGVLCTPSGQGGRCISMTPALNISEDLLRVALRGLCDCLSEDF